MKRGKRRKGFSRPERRPTGLAARLRRKRLKKAAVTLSKDIRLNPLLMPSQQFDRLSPSWGVWEEDRVNLPQFDGHFEKEYTMNLKGVSNEKEAGIFAGV